MIWWTVWFSGQLRIRWSGFGKHNFGLSLLIHRPLSPWWIVGNWPEAAIFWHTSSSKLPPVPDWAGYSFGLYIAPVPFYSFLLLPAPLYVVVSRSCSFWCSFYHSKCFWEFYFEIVSITWSLWLQFSHLQCETNNAYSDFSWSCHKNQMKNILQIVKCKVDVTN